MHKEANMGDIVRMANLPLFTTNFLFFLARLIGIMTHIAAEAGIGISIKKSALHYGK
jgi:citrate synthase